MPKMNVITEEVDYAKIKENESGPSCSLAEALEKQDLFINSTLAHIGVICSGKCSRKERHCIAVSMSIWIH